MYLGQVALGPRAASASRDRRRGRTARAAPPGWRGCARRRGLRRRIVGSCNSRSATALAIASTRAMSRCEADSQRPAFSASTCSTIVFAVLVQRGDRRQRVELAEPAREAADLLLDDLLAPRRLLGARVEVARPPPPAGRRCRTASRPRVRRSAWSMSRGTAMSIKQQRAGPRAGPSPARAPRARRSGAARRSRRPRCRPPRAARAAARGPPPAAEALRQAERPVGVAVGHEDRAGALVGQRPGGELAGLARADDHDVALGRGRRARSGARSDRNRRHAHAAGADRRLGPHPLAGRQRGREQAVAERARWRRRAAPPRRRA